MMLENPQSEYQKAPQTPSFALAEIMKKLFLGSLELYLRVTMIPLGM